MADRIDADGMARLRELLDAGTPGRWERRLDGGGLPLIVVSPESTMPGQRVAGTAAAADAALIVAAVNALPDMLAEVDRLRAEHDDLLARNAALRLRGPNEEALVGMGERFLARAEKAEAERDALLAVARWAKEAPHHRRCQRAPATTYPCTCGRDDALAGVDLGDDRG